MQSLALNVEVLNAEGVAVQMKDDYFEFDRAAEELGINLSSNESLSVDNEFTGF